MEPVAPEGGVRNYLFPRGERRLEKEPDGVAGLDKRQYKGEARTQFVKGTEVESIAAPQGRRFCGTWSWFVSSRMSREVPNALKPS